MKLNVTLARKPHVTNPEHQDPTQLADINEKHFPDQQTHEEQASLPQPKLKSYFSKSYKQSFNFPNFEDEFGLAHKDPPKHNWTP